MALWKTEDEQAFPGVRFDSDEQRWDGGYAVPVHDEKPDFVKKDDSGWDYVTDSKNK